ncbi:patatin-like phospholipase family protein [Amycolatopsis rhabdoformis]|uniref:Patatin-like phospholipase family protein n=1 Tax=Amycolatopsis rhabdoformis TaxID=1448059 RepID=A0ABZ1I328_9PSEU|nr:patatin-like phospholipase family protein [Amycolatopsis rhabdoformis]WSE28060.1 patatin-like phospholipase family protein [Amycolatopsis rhabdoformis]
MTEALVLGGGGVAGIAWMTGLLTGLADAGRDVSGADLIVGTSAGSTVAAQIGSGLSLGELYVRQTDPAYQSPEIPVELDLETFGAQFATALSSGGSVTDMRRAIGALALSASTVPEARRLSVIEARLPSHEWPTRDLAIIAVDATTGEPRAFRNDSGVPLVTAVAASCAVPGIWPPVTIGDHRYVDGGVRSGDNTDYATGYDRVTVILPLGSVEAFPTDRPFADVVASLRAAGSTVAVIEPDATSLTAIGTNPLDPETRRPAAEAGRAQGKGLEIVWS